MSKLYDFYCTCKLLKELWNSLNKIYVSEDVDSNKVVVGRLLDFKIYNYIFMVSQSEELQIIITEVSTEGCSIINGFHVTLIFLSSLMLKGVQK